MHIFNLSNNSVKLSSELKAGVDHSLRWDLLGISLLLHEEEAVTPYLPLDSLLVAVVSYELLEFRVFINHEEAVGVGQLQGLVGLLGGAGDLKADGVHEFVHKELVGLMGHILLL